jgi:hypothetical protein
VAVVLGVSDSPALSGFAERPTLSPEIAFALRPIATAIPRPSRPSPRPAKICRPFMLAMLAPAG